MPTYTIKNKKTGKSYDMPWDGPDPPTPYDMAKFSDDQEQVYPTTLQKVNKWRQTPLADMLPDAVNPQKLSDKYIKPMTEEGMATSNTLGGKAKMYGGAFLENLAGMASQATRPDEAAILAATAGAGSVAGAGYKGLGYAMGLPGRVMAGKMGLEGAGEAYKGAKEGDWTSVGTGTTKALLGAAGAAYNPASRVPKPVVPEETGLASIAPKTPPPVEPPPPGTALMRKPLPRVTSEPIYDAEVSPQQPKALPPARSSDVTYPEQPPPASIAPQGLPPKRPVFYGGPQGGPVSTNINEVPTRVFGGGPGEAPALPTRGGWSSAIGKLRPKTGSSLEDVTPSGASWRDILEQNSPYGRIMRGGKLEDFTNEQPGQVTPPVAPIKTGSIVEGPTNPVAPAPIIRPAPTGGLRSWLNKSAAPAKSIEDIAQPPVAARPPVGPLEGQDWLKGNISDKANALWDKVKGEQGAVGDVEGDPLSPANKIKLATSNGPSKTWSSSLGEAELALRQSGYSAEEAAKLVDESPRAQNITRSGLKAAPNPAAAKFAAKFGLPNDAEMAADMAGKKVVPGVPDAAEPGLEQPARKMKFSETSLARPLTDETGAIGDIRKAFKSKVPALSKEARQLQKDNHFNAKDWSTERAAASQHGVFEAQDFADLKPGGLDLIKKFRAGDRSGRLADVQKWADKLYADEKAAGLNVSTKSNFMEAIAKPQFVGKDGASLPPGLKPPATYQEGAQMGLSPKYNDLAEMIKDRTRRSKVALANKKFDTYLESTDQKTPETFDKAGKPVYASVNNPSRLRLKGPEADTLDYLINNVHMKPNKYWQTSGMLAGKSKNLTLTGGFPGTVANMHGGSILRSMHQVMGNEGVVKFLKGATNKDYLASEAERLRPLVREALDKGYQHTAGESEGLDSFHQWLEKYPVGEYISKGMKLQEKWFEDPLFKDALPVFKAQVLESRVNDLSSRVDKAGNKLSRDQVLRKASDQSNDFMGGQNTTLRNKDIKNQAKTFILAPDWAESQLNRGVKGYKAMFGKEDPIYRTAMLRSGAIRAAGGAIQAGSDSSKNDDPNDNQDWSDIGQHPGDLTTIGLGKTASGRFRELPLYGNASEGLRFPEEIIRAAAKGDWSAGSKILGNRTSQLAQTGMNFLRAQDAFGNPMTGKDKFGRQITGGQTLANYLDEMTKPITPQPIQAGISYLRDKQGAEEALSQSFESPLKYSAPPKPARGSGGRSRGRHR